MLNNLKFIPGYFLGQMRRIYFMALPETENDFKKSRNYFTTADSAAQTIAQLSGGAFLASVMTYSGLSDSNIGIITSLTSFAALSQFFLINYFKKLKKYKLLVCVTALMRTSFALIYFIPVISLREDVKPFAIVLLYLLGQIFVQIGTPASQEWIASLVPSKLRGQYFTSKDSIAVFVVSTLMLLCGMILDYFKKINPIMGYIIIGVIIFILTLINVIALSGMKEPKTSFTNSDGKEMHGRLAKKAKLIELEHNKNNTEGIIYEIKGAFQNIKFRKAFTLQCLYIIAFYICVPFNASYQINDLKLPYTFMMTVSFITNLYRIYLSPKLGRRADLYGMAKLLRYSLLALGFNFLIIAFSVPGNAYPLYVVAAIVGSTAWSFLGIGLFGIQLDFYKSEKRMIWLTITSSLSGILGFFVSVLGGKLLDLLQRNPISLFGTPLYAQQVLNILGFILILFATLYIKLYIETEKIEINNNDGMM